MDSYGSYGRSPPLPTRIESRDRDDYGRPPTEAYRDTRDRRRSPARPRGGRGRSRSPAAIDRYQPDRLPRDDYYDSRAREDLNRDRRRSSPKPMPPSIDRYVPGQDPPTPIILTNPLPDPMKLEYQVGFNWFAEWWRKEQQIKEERDRQKNGGRRPERLKGEREIREERENERAKIQAAYDLYKETLQKQMAQTFVRFHKSMDWFREKYVPEVRDPFRAKLCDFRRGLFGQWEQDLQAGTFDAFTLEGIYKSESNGAGGVVEKEEGETTAAAEVLGVGDLLPCKGGDLRDEVAQQPTLLVITIAPTVSRERMEAFCKEHLGEHEGGFKWLSLSDPNPTKKCHRMGWIMLNPAPEGAAHEEGSDVRNDRDDRDHHADDGEDGEEDGDAAMATEPASSLLTTAERALDKINAKTISDPDRGEFTVHCGIHRTPDVPRKKALWDLFSAPERIERDLHLATRIVAKLDEELGEDYNGLARIEQRVEELAGKGWLQPPIPATSTKKAKPEADEFEDGEDETMEEGEEAEDGAYDEETDDEELLTKKKRLDLMVEYLRRVYNFCFFCVFESDSVHELQRKCPGGHLRRPRASLTSAAKATAKASAYGEPFPLRRQESSVGEGDPTGSPVEERKFARPNSKSQQQLQRAYNWVKTFEEKLLQMLEPENVDLKKIGGKPVEEGVEEELNKFVKQEDEQKFRCKVPECTKLFKAHNFWRKHVEKRHTEWFEGIKADVKLLYTTDIVAFANTLFKVTLVNAYVLDPAHIAPSRSDANSNGHFPINNNNMPMGTPRGFNLATVGMPFGFANAMSAMPPNTPAGFPGFFAQHNSAGSMPQNWGIPGADFHQAGPIRNAGMRMHNPRAPGPYDRGMRDGRNGGRGGWSGRLTPPRMNNGGMSMGRPMGGGAGLNRFSEGGAATVGPREAVQGRSIKSYEDLDAVGNEGNGELNY
ncbi:hypothetical protein LTR66_009637 [Elasticomyces elasticus]|nr:hypothetical protein LTR66_009637 [Elasticomyces elasticus]